VTNDFFLWDRNDGSSKERGMSLIKHLRQKSASLTTASKYTALNGIGYLVVGAILIVWPGVTQMLFREPAFVGHEQALMRVIGLTVVVIGWLYLFGGRSGARQFVAASVIDRLLFVPGVLIPLAIAGVFPRLFLTFTLLDASLVIGAWILLARE
jgi:hypothetical protein